MDINNLEFNVRVAGDGVPFIWSHGLMGSMSHDTRSQFLDWEKLATKTRLVRYDARGHGKTVFSDSPEDYRWSRLADDMLRIADSLQMDKFVAAGHSMGCATALYTALKAPDRVQALVLANPPTAWDTRAAQVAMYERLAEMVEKNGVSSLLRLFTAYPMTPAWQLETHPQWNRFFLDSLGQFGDKQLATILRGAKLCDLPTYEELKSVTTPALVLAWVDDTTHPLESADVLIQLMPNTRLVVATTMEEVATWSDQILEYLNVQV